MQSTIRNKILLRDNWSFVKTSLEDGVEKCFPSDKHSLFEHKINIPFCFDQLDDYQSHYEGSGWFKTQFKVSEDWQEKRVFLNFMGLMHHSRVWLNGNEIATHNNGFLAFSVDINEQLDFENDNDLVIYIDNFRRQEDLTGKEFGWRNYGGILRDVLLCSSAQTYLDTPLINATPKEKNAGALDIRINLINHSEKTFYGEFQYELLDQDRCVFKSIAENYSCSANSRVKIHLNTDIEFVQLWEPESPRLYKLKLTLVQNQDVIDCLEETIGFRAVEISGKDVLLNGKKIFFKGFNRHDDSLEQGMIYNSEQTLKDLNDMKALGSNFVRLAHYPHHPDELKLCDEIGLLTMSEIPLYWWDTNKENEQESKDKVEHALYQVKEMIMQYFNHPSIIFWSVSNETAEIRVPVVEGNNYLVQYAKQIDDSRFCVHVSNHWSPSLKCLTQFDYDDIICINWYPSFDNKNYDKGKQLWNDELVLLHETHPDKLIFITEFGAPSTPESDEAHMTENFQLNVIKSEASVFNKPYICGTLIWCYADHAWPENKDMKLGYEISPYGVVKHDRSPKKVYYELKSLFGQLNG